MKHLSTPWRICGLTALALAAFGGNALAADLPQELASNSAQERVQPPLLAAPTAPSVTSSALQAAIDPATGMLRPPTAGERLELAAIARGTASGLRRAVAASEVVHADGMLSLAVDPALHSMSTVVVGADGQVHFSCGDAGHFHATTATAPAAEGR